MRQDLHTFRTIGSFGRLWAASLANKIGLASAHDKMLRPRVIGASPPYDESLLHRYIVATGGAPDLYRTRNGQMLVPPTFFGTWGLGEFSRVLLDAKLPLNYARAIHAGSSVRVHRHQLASERSVFAVTVETVVHTDDRVRVELKLSTATDAGEPLADHVLAIVLPGRRRPTRSAVTGNRIPSEARPLGGFELLGNEGWEYAKLSGDFNPIHWLSPVAKVWGLPGVIAHGFDLMARLTHIAVRRLADGEAERLTLLDVTFRKPVPLPAELHVFSDSPREIRDEEQSISVWLGPQQDAPAHVFGEIQVRNSQFGSRPL